MKMVAIEETRWQLSRGGARTIIAADLNPEAKVWAAFVKTNLLRTTHDTTLLADRVLLVYAIIMNLSIDVGKIVADEIVKCASKKVGRLFFPQLITMLCLEAAVPFDEEEERLEARNLMDYIETHRDGASSGKKRDSRATDDMDQLLKQQEALLSWCENSEGSCKAYWSYVKKRDEEIHKALRTKSKNSAFPSFPDEIFKEWSRKESSHAVEEEENTSSNDA